MSNRATDDDSAGPDRPMPDIAPAADRPTTTVRSPTEEVDCRHCGGFNRAGSTLCAHCPAIDPGGPMRARLEFRPVDPPHTGPSPVLYKREGDRVELGRGSGRPAEIAAALNPYDFVSRDHAVVHVLRRRIEITDRSTNGTWVGVERIAAGTSRTFNLPVELSLGRECSVSITVEP